jgi:hypothetical protein
MKCIRTSLTSAMASSNRRNCFARSDRLAASSAASLSSAAISAFTASILAYTCIHTHTHIYIYTTYVSIMSDIRVYTHVCKVNVNVCVRTSVSAREGTASIVRANTSYSSLFARILRSLLSSARASLISPFTTSMSFSTHTYIHTHTRSYSVRKHRERDREIGWLHTHTHTHTICECVCDLTNLLVRRVIFPQLPRTRRNNTLRPQCMELIPPQSTCQCIYALCAV